LRQETADFILYVKDSHADPVVFWHPLTKMVQANTLTLELMRLGKTKAGFIILDGKVTSHEPLQLTPEQFWIFQNNESRVINGLYLSSLKVNSKMTVRFGISLAKSDLDFSKPIRLELRLKPTIGVAISEELLWK
jgi:hypothetical protein